MLNRKRPRTPLTRLSQLLDDTGRKKMWFAERLGMTPSHLSHTLSGKRSFPPRKRAQAAELLGVTESWLFSNPDGTPIPWSVPANESDAA